MSAFTYIDGTLACDGVAVDTITERFGTPLYIYSAATIRERVARVRDAFAALQPEIYYAVKANGNLAILKLLRGLGVGFDIVSGGELARALAAGADPKAIAFAGVGKTNAEMNVALEAGVGWFNVESSDEATRLNALAVACGLRARVALRLNPDVEPDTHRHIRTGGAASKFGLPLDQAHALAQRWSDFPALDLHGAHIHIGSQMAAAGPWRAALDAMLGFVEAYSSITHVDLGGGLPVSYTDAAAPDPATFAAPLVERLQPFVGRLTIGLEPGRYLVAESGLLVTEVQAVKTMAGRRLAVVDTGMHHLIRPMLYEASHRIWPVRTAEALGPADVVGPICESTDVLDRDVRLPALEYGDLLAVRDVGAYGFSMASNYNAQPRPAEVLVDGGEARLVRRRETADDLMVLERDFG
jgi:diaminopimelate decarboxylase